MIRTQIQLTAAQAEALKRISASRHLSIAELIRRAIDMMIKTSTLIDPEERLKRSLEIVGKFGSGRKDISRQHDAYLAETYGK